MSCFYYLPNLPYFLFCLLKYINLKAFGNYPWSRLEMNQVALTSSRFSDIQHTRAPELLTAKQVDDYLTNPIAKRMVIVFNNWLGRPKVESQKWDEARWSQQVFWIKYLCYKISIGLSSYNISIKREHAYLWILTWTWTSQEWAARWRRGRPQRWKSGGEEQDHKEEQL